jgi:asparagine synthase (glutamine-hydrolysing)
MCGLIAAVWKRRPENYDTAIRSACARMAPRGPDAEGVWHGYNVSLGHRRLSILDLDKRSDQPMSLPGERYSIVFNGEIYNFRSLRAQLLEAGIRFTTESDTEVLLRLFERDGADMLSVLRGMFAFAIWDSITHRLFVARDPYGIKPLYFAETDVGFLFASQVKALTATGFVSNAPDAWGQAAFWLTGSVLEPNTWYDGVKAFPPGHCGWVDERGLQGLICWFDVSADWRSGEGARSDDDAIRTSVKQAVRESVSAHLVADVPVGVFLSGGIDSGAIAALVKEAGSNSLKGVTIAFEEFDGTDSDESPVAAQIARHYGIQHHIRTVTRNEFLDDIPRILDSMDQPTVDGVNTWYASKATAELGLKVVLSGLGGDELFQGYGHFRILPRLVLANQIARAVPGAMHLAQLACDLQARRSGNSRWRELPVRSRSLPGVWLSRRGLFSVEDLPELMGVELAHEALESADPLEWIEVQAGLMPADPRVAVSLLESRFYLRNQLLRDSDWASMAHSVELRTPLVDAWLLRSLAPMAGAFRRFPNKSLLANSPNDALPNVIVNRRKTGFGIPVNEWLGSHASSSHPTRSWATVVAEHVS